MEEVGRVEVGRFVYENGTVSGPAEYMKERGFDRLRKIEAGDDVVVRVAMGGEPYPGSWIGRRETGCPNVETAVLVSLQTDYAAWAGAKQTQSFLDRAAAVRERYEAAEREREARRS